MYLTLYQHSIFVIIHFILYTYEKRLLQEYSLDPYCRRYQVMLHGLLSCTDFWLFVNCSKFVSIFYFYFYFLQIEVNMTVEYLSFSAHADAKGISKLISYCAPRNVMLVHGENAKMEFLKKKINKEFREPFFPLIIASLFLFVSFDVLLLNKGTHFINFTNCFFSESLLGLELSVIHNLPREQYNAQGGWSS